MSRRLTKADFERLVRRPPDFVIGDPSRPYIRRWWLIPRNRFANVYLHAIHRDDDDRALHDHPWVNCSIVLRGVLREVTPDRVNMLRPGDVVLRRATALHRLEVVEGPVWTLFLTGPRVREWGFQCPKGWVPWREFVNPERPGEVGRGCGEYA